MQLGSYLQPNGNLAPDQLKFESYSQQYVYTKLGEAAAGHTEPYNIYGIVLDAGAPYVKNRPTCTVRLIDQSLNQKAAGFTGTA